MSPGPAAALLAALGVAALLAGRIGFVAVIAALLLAVCLRSGRRSRPYLLGIVFTSGSLERGLNLAEAMEARGYGRPGATQAPRAALTALDVAALGTAVAIVVAGKLWL